MSSRHAASAEHPNDMSVFPAHIFEPNAGIGSNPHML
jgi:hypothetical protein